MENNMNTHDLDLKAWQLVECEPWMKVLPIT